MHLVLMLSATFLAILENVAVVDMFGSKVIHDGFELLNLITKNLNLVCLVWNIVVNSVRMTNIERITYWMPRRELYVGGNFCYRQYAEAVRQARQFITYDQMLALL